MNLPIETEEEYAATAERRLRECWAQCTPETRDRYVSEALPGQIARFAKIRRIVTGEHQGLLSGADWVLGAIYGRPIVAADACLAMHAYSIVESAISAARYGESERIAAALSADLRKHYGETAADLIAGDIMRDYERNS